MSSHFRRQVTSARRQAAFLGESLPGEAGKLRRRARLTASAALDRR